MIPHGTANGYANHRCRCSLCREAWRVYRTSNRRQVAWTKAMNKARSRLVEEYPDRYRELLDEELEKALGSVGS